MFVRSMLKRFQCALFLVLFGISAISFAQETVNYASVSGQVTDPSGAFVAGASVTARQTDTNALNTTVTDSEGRFRFPYLTIGPYEITVRQRGFADARHALTLTIGAAFDLTIPLSLEASAEATTVTAEAPVMDTARTQVAGTILQNEVGNLPLNGRRFLDLTLLVPGVSPTNTQATQLFAETSAVAGQGISINSQRNFSNSFIVDGLSDNDDASGLTLSSYGLDVVQEFQVVTASGQAEFGRALAGYISMATKSGTNEMHGDVYGFFRDKALNAPNALSHTRLPITQSQYGASLGGPIVKDRTFYFANFEQFLLNQAGSPVITIPSSSVSPINTQLIADSYPGSLISTGNYPNPVHSANFFSKVDHRFSDKDQFSGRYSLYKVNAINSRNVGGSSAVSAGADLTDLDQALTASNIYLFSSNTANETRAQFVSSNLLAPPTDPIGPAVSVAGIAFGTLSGSPTARLDRMFEIADNLSHQTGPHAFRTGVDFIYNDDTITFPRSIRGSYTFSSLSNFLAGVYNNTGGFSQTFGNSMVHQNNPSVGFYGQDEWKVSNGLTLNLGIRYDLQFLKTIVTDKNNVAPRLGFAWSPFKSRTTVIRAGYGIYFDRVPLRAVANALLSANNTTSLADVNQFSVSLGYGQTGAPIFPNILNAASLPAGVLFNFATMDPNMRNAFAEQGSLGIEHQFGAKSTVEVNYTHIRGHDLIIQVNQNVPTCVTSGSNNGCRPNASYGDNKQYSPLADSQYDGVSISYVQRPVKWGNFRASYTYSRAFDDVSESFFSAPLNNFNIHQDWARSDDDPRMDSRHSRSSCSCQLNPGCIAFPRSKHMWMACRFHGQISSREHHIQLRLYWSAQNKRSDGV